MKRFHFYLACAAVIFIAVVRSGIGLKGQPPARPQRRVALLVGPKTYLHDFSALNYTAQDVTAVGDLLRAGGFDEVMVLTDPPEGKNPATKENITNQLKRLLDGNGNKTNAIRQGDVVMVVLSGHGQELDGPDPANPGRTRRDTYFAPVDGKKGKRDTLVSLSELVDDVLAPSGGRSLLLVDACREIYDPNKGKGIGGKHVSLTGQTAVLFSCSTAELSWESDEVKHGVFSYAVLETLKKAQADNETVTWNELVAGVEKKMNSQSYRKFVPEPYSQTPVLASGQVPSTTLMTVRATNEPKAGDEIEFEIGKDVKLRLCWIPGGKFTMGSPKGEKQRSDDETEHEVELSGFWMAKFHVTQKQYVTLSGKSNPSSFCANGDRKEKVAGMDTDDFPVDSVSWDDAKEWLKELQRKIDSGDVKLPARLRGWKVALPSEAQWEYAARGGKGNGRPFYWGDELNGIQSNCDGNFPYGTATKGPYLERTSKVGSYEKVSPHPWGLCDMSGNVYSWCEDFYGKYENVPNKKDAIQSAKQEQEARVLRGGSWIRDPWSCRCANRDWGAASDRYYFIGFRVVFRLD